MKTPVLVTTAFSALIPNPTGYHIQIDYYLPLDFIPSADNHTTQVLPGFSSQSIKIILEVAISEHEMTPKLTA
jgi:hypothetical protein